MFTRRLFVSNIKSRFTYSVYTRPDCGFHFTRNYSISHNIINRSGALHNGKSLLFSKYSNQRISFNTVRSLSDASESDKASEVIDLTQSIDLKEPVQDSLLDLTSTITQSDVPLTALGLGSNYTPIGWCVHYLDFLSSVFPWWGAIAVATVILRVSMFPLVVSSQKTSAKLNEILPEQAILKEKMNQARIVGDEIEFARISNEFHTLFKRKGVNPLKAMVTPFVQMPVFITFFLTLRRMSYYPVESLKTGGILWFTDLSIADPFYILPIVTTITMWLTLELSFRTGMNPNQTPLIKYGARVLPLVTLLFVFDFPTAILTYWFTNNIISLLQVMLLKQHSVREFLNIPQIKVNPRQLDVNKKSFTKHFRETMDNAKVKKLLEERNKVDEIAFQKSGIGPLKKTFKKDPTRAKNN